MTTTTQPSEDFRNGAKAMFDYLLYRAANNYHGNPKINERCAQENALVESWAAEALHSVTPEDHDEWKAIGDAYSEGLERGRVEGARPVTAAEDGLLRRAAARASKLIAKGRLL